MFTFLKILKLFFLLPTLIAIGMAASFFSFIYKRHRLGKFILLFTLVFYYLFSIEPVAYFLAKSLESKVEMQNSDIDINDVEAIVVLAGGVQKKEGYRPYHELGGVSWRRLWHGIRLYKEFDGRIPILYSGGSGNPFNPVTVEAELAKGYALSMGIHEDKFWIETISRNTHESGREIKKFLDNQFPEIDKHKIILVTSAAHMPRSLKTMNKAGLYAIPSSADFMKGSLELNLLSFFPSVSNFFISTFSIHEWMGIIDYWLFGKA